MKRSRFSEDQIIGILKEHRRLPGGRADEERLVEDMIELTRQFGRYGYRRVAAPLRDAA